ncbi:MAG: RHS repeat-associated core domain-containing protein, partial [Candidatus Sulfotelmatobacter sp.]
MMQSPRSHRRLSGCTSKIEGFFSLVAEPQLVENSRLGSEGENPTPTPNFTAPKSQTTQWDGWHLSGGTASVPSVYLYDGSLRQGWNVIEEVDNSGNVLARYTQGQVMDQTFAELRSDVTSYFEQDGIGSITSLSNPASALANTYTYDSFGKLTASTGTLTNPFQFTGREFDPETGIYQYRARYYDQRGGRFISEDPMGFDSGVNFYDYVKNRPLDSVDPLGLSTLVFDREGGLLYIYDAFGNLLAVCEAHNNAATGSVGIWPNGSYPYLYHKNHPPDPNGGFGSYGIF